MTNPTYPTSDVMELARREEAENAVCLLPSEDADHGLTDWERLASDENLDVLATDPYWAIHAPDKGSEEFVGYFADLVSSLAAEYDKRSQIWIQGFGVNSVFMWGYDACRTISSIRCGDPEAVWNAYLDELPE